MTASVLGIIGGSGIYDLPGLANVVERRIDEPVGRAVGAAAHRRYRRPAGGVPAAPRQGPSPVALRHRLPRQYRRAQARRRHRSRLALRLRVVQGGTAAGHLRAGRPVRRPHLRPRRARSSARAASPMSRWPIRCRRACASTSSPRRRPKGIAIARGGTYVCMEGPQFSTLAESLTYKQLGYSVIGMTNMPEAKLAREAEICYATVAMVTDFDCWHPDHDAVTVQDIIKVLTRECRQGEAPGGAAGAGFSPPARAMPDRLRPRPRQCHHHRAGGARSRPHEQARRRGGTPARVPSMRLPR